MRWLFALLLLTTEAAHGQASRGLLVRNGTVVTMDARHRIVAGGAVAIADGRIAAVGTSAELAERFAGYQVIEAKGKAVIPGLINLHTHSSMVFLRGLVDDENLEGWSAKLQAWHSADDLPDYRIWADRQAVLEMAKSGTTTFVEMYHYPELAAKAAQEAGLRALVTLRLPFERSTGRLDEMQAEAAFRSLRDRFTGDRLITVGLAAHAPHTVPEPVLRYTRALATKYKVPLLVHLAEGEAESRFTEGRCHCTPAQYLETLGFLGQDVLAIHAVRLTDEDIALLARRKVGVAHNPESNAKLGNGVARIPEMLKAGIAVGLGTDSAASNNNLDLFEEMDSAVKLQRAVRKDAKALSARQALEMATIGAARAIGRQDDLGSLEAGKRADLLLVDLDTPELQPVYDVESQLVFAIKGNRVAGSIVDGRIVMENRQVIGLNETEIAAKARYYREAVLKENKH